MTTTVVVTSELLLPPLQLTTVEAAEVAWAIIFVWVVGWSFCMVICGCCAVAFFVNKTIIKNGGGKFCSQKCYYAAKIKSVLFTRSCRKCSTAFCFPRDRDYRYCPKCVHRSDPNVCWSEPKELETV